MTDKNRSSAKEAKAFKKKLDWLISKLTDWERKKGSESAFYQLRLTCDREIYNLPKTEISLFFRLFDLFTLKQRQLSLGNIFHWQLAKKPPGKYLCFLGPLGVGKSTLAKALIKDLHAKYIVKEPFRKNPFWGKSQENPSYMLRSQVYFLLSNIFSDMQAKLNPQIAISDTSTLTDILMWVDWYFQIGHFTKNDYQTYQQLVKLLKAVIPLPDLLIILLPDSTENLYNGIRQRQKKEPWRKGELVFNRKDLFVQTEKVRQISQKIATDWRVKTVTIKVNPILIHTSFPLRMACLRKIGKGLKN